MRSRGSTRKGRPFSRRAPFGAIEKSLEIARASGGGFDPTLTNNGYARVELFADSSLVRLPHGMALDLGAVAKGFAVDRALAELEGVATGGLVDLGTSSIALFGSGRRHIRDSRPGGRSTAGDVSPERGRDRLVELRPARRPHYGSSNGEIFLRG